MKILIHNPGTHPELQWIAAELSSQGHEVIYNTAIGVVSKDRSRHRLRYFFNPMGRQLQQRELPKEIKRSAIRRGALVHEVRSVLNLRRGETSAHLDAIDRRNEILDDKAARITQQFRPDLVMSQIFNGHRLPEMCDHLGIPLALNVPLPFGPLVREFMDEEKLRNPEWSAYLQADHLRPAQLRASRAELSAATWAIVASQLTAESLRRLEFKGRIVLAPLAVPLRPDSDDICVPRRQRILFVGQVSQRKGMSYLFEALEMGLPGNPVLTLIGPDYKNMVDALRTKFPTVTFNYLGPLARGDLSTHYKDHSIFVFPSLLEGFGLAMVEAIAHGLPVVATPRSAAFDLNVHRQFGLVVPAGDSQALHQALTELLTDEKQLLSYSATGVRWSKRLTRSSFAKSVVEEIIISGVVSSP